MADGDSVKRALLNFMMKETFAFTQNCNEDSSTLGETTTTIGSGSATNLTETEASVESRSTLPSRRKESGRLLRQNSLVRSLVRPTMAGFLIVALLPLLLERMCEWRQIRRHGPLGDGDSTLTVKLPEMPLGQDAECLLSGNVKDCSCQFSQVDALNEEIVRPKLNEIVNKRFFSYFKVDLHCACPFWPEDGMCNMPACSVCECSEDEVRDPWRSLSISVVDPSRSLTAIGDQFFFFFFYRSCDTGSRSLALGVSSSARSCARLGRLGKQKGRHFRRS